MKIFKIKEKTVTYMEVDLLLQKSLIKETYHESHILVSSTFIQPKNDAGLNEI